VTARRATSDDVPEVVRLAGVMYRSMGHDASPEWWRVAAAAFTRRLDRDATAFVVDDPSAPGRLAASAVGSVSERFPGPRNLAGRVGYVQWVATDPGQRRRGHARAVIVALLDWFESEGASAVELHATTEAEPLYRSLGFAEGPNRALRLLRP